MRRSIEQQARTMKLPRFLVPAAALVLCACHGESVDETAARVTAMVGAPTSSEEENAALLTAMIEKRLDNDRPTCVKNITITLRGEPKSGTTWALRMIIEVSNVASTLGRIRISARLLFPPRDRVTPAIPPRRALRARMRTRGRRRVLPPARARL